MAAGSARWPRPGSAATGLHRGRLCYQQDGQAAAHRRALPAPAPLWVPPRRRLGSGGCCLPAPLPILGDPAPASEEEPGAQGAGSLSLKSKSGHWPSPHGLGEVSPAVADIEKEAGSRVLAARRWWSAGDGHHCWMPPAPTPGPGGGSGRAANPGRPLCSPGSLATCWR